ncbi:MAG: hypothetical protein AAB553_03920 [Patescibacteria group bacterium]
MREFFRNKISGLRSKDVPPPKEKPPVTMIELQTPAGLETFGSRIAQTNGTAAIVVHPFFPDWNPSRFADRIYKASYENYIDLLARSTRRHRENGLPLIILEEDIVLNKLPTNLSRIGVDSGDVFVVPTHDSTPEPIQGNLTALARNLQNIGLARAVVSGSYLWVNGPKIDHFSFTPGMPGIYERNSFQGCVGYTINALLRAGVKTTHGVGTFPPEKDWSR